MKYKYKSINIKLNTFDINFNFLIHCTFVNIKSFQERRIYISHLDFKTKEKLKYIRHWGYSKGA